MGAEHATRIIDADGHIYEDLEGIIRRFPDSWKGNITTARSFGPFPQLDHIHHHLHVVLLQAFNDPGGVKGWSQFLDNIGISFAALYPTLGLGFGRIMDLDWAYGVAQAYNDWLYDAYLKHDSRLIGIGLIPMQEPKLATRELRRIVEELGMRGALLPATGLKAHLGAKEYWPVYEEADRLSCALAVHGGAHSGLGLDTLNVFAAVHSMGHPVGIMSGFVSLLFNGVFDKFPNARFGFLEGGVAWLLMARERCDSSYRAFTPLDPRRELLQLRPGESIPEYLQRQIDGGRVLVGVEGDEPDLPYAVRVFGNKPFMFSTDFPHEVNTEICKHEVEEIAENEGLTDDDKEAIFHRNAERFYKL